jgi:hypothetical protein
MPDDADLVYDGRARKRPSGASDLTQRIYMLLHDHPDGMTLDEIHGVLAEGWLETDCYRAYEQHLSKHRKSLTERPPRSTIGPRDAYGSEQFKKRAKRWAITGVLHSMRSNRVVRRDGDRWFKGERAPRITIHESKPRYVTHDWAAERRNAYRASTDAAVRREEIKAELFTALSDGRLKGKSREVVQHAYDYLCGR